MSSQATKIVCHPQINIIALKFLVYKNQVIFVQNKVLKFKKLETIIFKISSIVKPR